MKLSPQTRLQNIKKLQTDVFDLVVIGGGISGAGVARDAASRGMKVALVEAQDFAAGTSSRSSKLIHGGIRYLENLEFGLVFEALSERQKLFDIAPHLVHPLRFMLPVYEGARVGMFKLGLGMWLYDLLSLFEAPELHARMDNRATLKRAPILNSKQLVGSYMYSDAYMDDDRLVIETIRSAADIGATAVNYVRACGAEFQDKKMTAAVCRDELTGAEIKIRGRHFVSTVGPWTDELATKLLTDWKKIMRPSKGVHLTFHRKRLPITDAVVMVSDDQKRIVFAIPRHEMVIIGTTDTDYSGDPIDVHTTSEDVTYLLHVAGHYFPGANLKRSDIIASYSGIRPLVDDGSETESKTSREHLVLYDPRNITFVTGGKYTTYRKIAEDTLRVVLDHFSLEDQMRWRLCQTNVPLNSLATREKLERSRLLAPRWSQEFNIDVGTVHFLVERYGEEAYLILEQHLHKISCSEPNLRWHLEAHHSIQETMCHNLLDFYLRRVPLFLAREDHGLLLLNELSQIFQKELNWSDDQRIEATNALRKHMTHEMSWRHLAK